MPQRPLEARDAVGARPRTLEDALQGEVRIRRATDADAPALVPLINEVYRQREWGLFESWRTSDKELREALAEPATTVYVAEIAGEAVATIRLEIRPDDAYFGVLATRGDMQGRGLAPMLIAHAEREALAAGRATMHLGCIQDLGLQPYYESLGYRVASAKLSQDWGAVRPWTLIDMAKELA